MIPRPKREMTKRAPATGPTARALPFPDVVRLARVDEARRRIVSGWYDRADVRASLVDAVMQEFRDR